MSDAAMLPVGGAVFFRARRPRSAAPPGPALLKAVPLPVAVWAVPACTTQVRVAPGESGANGLMGTGHAGVGVGV